MVYYKGALMIHLYYLEKTNWDCAALTSLNVFLMFSHYFRIRLSSESRLALEQPFPD